jgi:hypothetical protein
MQSLILYILGFISYNFDLKEICLILISYLRPITHLNSLIDQHNCDKLLKYISQNSYYIQSHNINKSEKIPFGLCFNKNFITYINSETVTNNRNSKIEYFITFIGKLPNDIKINEDNNDSKSNKKDKKPKSINILMRQESYYDSKYVIQPQLFNYSPTKKQQKIINNIISNYENAHNKVGRYLIHGESGTGKSFISKLLAQKYNCPLTFQIKLDQPGNTISSVYSTLNKHDPLEKEKPLIVLLDEWDIMIKNIHYEKNYKQHEWLITEVYNKETYNTFLSETTQMFQNVIYIMTMNTNINEINEIDKSYLRNGRIDKIFNL